MTQNGAASALHVPEHAGDNTLSAWFLVVAAKHAARTALTLGSESMTFGQLRSAAETVAAGLQARGVGHGAVVAILLERSFAMVTAALGTVLAGAAYLPLDPTFPAARVQETLADAKPACVVAEPGLLELLLGTHTPVVLYERLAQAEETYVPVTVNGSDLAYIIYTSGSTGKPKGVLVTHSNVTRLLTATQPWFQFHEHDVWTLFHSFAFDFSVWEMWNCMLSGARLVIVPYMISRSPEEFLHLLWEERVTVLNQTPSAFSLLSRTEARYPVQASTLRWVIFGGEALSPRSLLPWFERHGDEQPALANMYGVTETTVHVTWRRMTRHDALHETESVLGEALPDLRIDLLDGALVPVATGAVGEMYVAGAGVALGYLDRPSLTAERFLPDPARGGGGRMYRTGDLARRRTDGELVYHGRADRQVKINGFRVELGEVEAALTACPGVHEGCVQLHVDAEGTQRLAAYYVLSQAGHKARMDSKTISGLLADYLPAPMRPSLYKPVERFPMTSNGKIDRLALPDPFEQIAGPLQQAFRTDMERVVAELWCTVLRVPSIDLNENFFDVGGTSLLLITLRRALEERLGRSLPIVWFFEHTTVRSLAGQVERTEQPAPATQNPAEQRAARQRGALARLRAARGSEPGRSVA